MRRAAALAALALGIAGAGAAGQGDSTWLDHNRAARKAFDTGDFSAFRAQLLALRREIGPLPVIDYNLAVAEARLGNGGRALEWLETFADMGVWQDAARDSNLASVRSMAGYARVARLLAANLQPVTGGAVAFTLPDADMIAEDIAYDSVGRRFLISSVRRRKIVAVDGAGRVSDFTRSGADSTWGMFALGIDQAHGLLWATTAAVAAAQGYGPADSGRSALLAYDLATGAVRARLDPPDPRRAHTLGDMTVGPDGTVYVSDATAGAVYTAAPGARSLTVLVPPGTLPSPQTPVLAADGRRVFVADYAAGIAEIDLATHALRWIARPGNVALAGTDGLYRVGNTLVAVQNGTTPNRVIRLLLDRSMTRVLDAEVLERGGPAAADPTHGVMIGDTFYFIARSGWNRVRPDGTLAPARALDVPAVWRLGLLPFP